MSHPHRIYRLLALVLIASMLLGPVQTPVTQAAPSAPAAPAQFQASGIYRTRVVIENSTRRARLDKLELVVLGEGDGWVMLLADADQLETLARLGFRPQASDDLAGLSANAAPEKAWLTAGLKPLLTQAASVQAQRAATEAAGASAAAAPDGITALRAAMQALTPEQVAGIASYPSNDFDGDGLSDGQESWWCTDPMNTDSDGDGTSDYAEVTALKDWMGNRRAGPPSSGKPFAGWPPLTTSAGNPGRTFACQDDDRDAVPDLAERWELGLNMNRESTDRDKFDDGQELFGYTNCPGGDASCGYGDLPRSSDSGFVGAAMPSWVKAPGNHPLVAAFPVPEVDVVESSLRVQTVTTITTDHAIASGTEKSYSTAKTEGTSDSVANSQIWNEWEESYVTNGTIQPGYSMSAIDGHIIPPGSITCPPIGSDPVYFSGEACTAVKFLVDFCADDAGSYSNGKCVKGAKKLGAQFKAADEAFQSDIRTAQQWLSNTFRTVKSQVVDTAGKTKDWIDNNLKLNSCSLGVPSGISCEIQFRQSEANQSGEIIEKSCYGTGGADSVGGLGSNQLRQIANSSVADLSTYYPLYYPSATISSQTQGGGRSWGGSQTNTHTTYEEHSITNGEAFSNEESWGNATAQDSVHAADFWFTYKVRNTGTEYAREIGDLAFNVYIGDHPNPVYTYFVGPDLGGDGKFHNFMPGEEHTYTARHIPLTLAQMKAVDLGGPIRVVVEDFSYGRTSFSTRTRPMQASCWRWKMARTTATRRLTPI